jgi:hypothetical protein
MDRSFWYSDATVRLRGGEAATADVELLRIASARQVGTLEVPESYPISEIGDYYRLPFGIAYGTAIPLRREGDGIVSFAFDAPDLTRLGGTRCLQALYGRATYLAATECGVPLGVAVSMRFQPPPKLSTPANGDVASSSTQFAWTRFENGVHELRLFSEKASRASPWIVIHTWQTTATWPDLRPFGISFPEATTDYRCAVGGRGPFASIDEAVVPHGLTASEHIIERLSFSTSVVLRISPNRT